MKPKLKLLIIGILALLLCATGNRVVEFDDCYVAQVTEGTPNIIVLIAHQDERAVLKRLGVIDA